MTTDEFFDMVENHTDLRGVGLSDTAAVVEHIPTQIYTSITLKGIAEIPENDMIDVLTMQREPEAVITMARVVGYYSRVDNWNQSKLGELRDRKKGNYTVTPLLNKKLW